MLRVLMTLRTDLRLPSLSAEACRRLEMSLTRLGVPPEEIWVVSVVESESPEADWLVLVTSGVELPELPSDWAFIAVEEKEDGERVCTYARQVPAAPRSPESILRCIEQLLRPAVARQAKLA
jgi:hypothetical protein